MNNIISIICSQYALSRNHDICQSKFVTESRMSNQLICHILHPPVRFTQKSADMQPDARPTDQPSKSAAKLHQGLKRIAIRFNDRRVCPRLKPLLEVTRLLTLKGVPLIGKKNVKSRKNHFIHRPESRQRTIKRNRATDGSTIKICRETASGIETYRNTFQ